MQLWPGYIASSITAPVSDERCWSHLEQFTTARHLCTLVACPTVMPQDSSLHHFLSQSVNMYSARKEYTYGTPIHVYAPRMKVIQTWVFRRCTLPQCSRSDTCHFGHFNRAWYLLTYLYTLPTNTMNKPFTRCFKSNDRRCVQFPIIHDDIVFSKQQRM